MAIPKSKDPVVIELERICKTQLAIPTEFVHASMGEANFGLDQLEDVNFPVLVHLATNRNKNELEPSHNIMRTVRMQLLLLDRVPLETVDFKAADVNERINLMRNLGENLIYWINKSPYSVNGGVADWNSDDVYQRMDAHLFGQAMEIEWKLDTGETGYYNNPGTV